MKEEIRESIRNYKDDLKLSDKDLQDTKINLLNNGENHIIYLVVVNNKKFVFRVSFRKELEKALKKEFEILAKIPNNLGPKPLVFDNTKKIIQNSYMVQSFIPGMNIKKWTRSLLNKHAKNISILHSHNKVQKKREINIYKLFLNKINSKKKNSLMIFEDKKIHEIVLLLDDLFKKNQQIFSNLKNTYLIHGDLHDDNILLSNNELRYVDWEEAHYGDNALDFASLLWFIQLNKEDYEYYLSSYKNNIKDRTLETRAILWLLYRDFSLLLHKKWQSLDPKTRAINVGENYSNKIQSICDRIRKRARLLN